MEHYTAHAADGTVSYDWRGIWVVAAVASAFVLVAFLVTFNDRQGEPADTRIGEQMAGIPV